MRLGHIVAVAALVWLALPSVGAAQSLAPARDAVGNDAARITIFADGTARTLLTGGEVGAGEAGSGAIGALLTTKRWSLRINVNAASSADSVTSGFGTFLLNPGVGTTSGGIEIQRDSLFNQRGLSMRAYTTVATAVWADDAGASNATMLGAGLLVVGSVNGRDSDDDIYSMRFFGGIAHRAVGGDISDEDDLRLRTFGSEQRSYWGLEGGTQMSLKNVTAGMGVSFIDNPDEGQIDGFSRFQATFSISIYGPVMSKDLRLF